jgi:hypothetical protein
VSGSSLGPRTLSTLEMCQDPEAVSEARGVQVSNPRDDANDSSDTAFVREGLLPWWLLNSASGGDPGSPHSNTVLVNGTPLAKPATETRTEEVSKNVSRPSATPDPSKGPTKAGTPLKGTPPKEKEDDDPPDIWDLTDEVLAQQQKYVCR